MAEGNGNGEVPRTVEQGREFAEAAAIAKAFAEGGSDDFAWTIQGADPYGDDWYANLDERFERCPDAKQGIVSEARLVVGEPIKRGPNRGRMREGSFKYHYLRGPRTDQALARIRETSGWQKRMAEWNWTPDPFAYGNPPIYGAGGGVLGQYLPLWPGPVTRQLYWQDYFAMSAKAFEAYNHDPISWRCVHMKQEFALGKGLQTRVTYGAGSQAGQTHDKAETVWQEFWKRNKMDQRMDMLARDLSIMGEQFLRYFVKNKLVTVRSLDPASIYDLITDPEDHETVFAYHQQFQTPYQLYPPESTTPSTGVQAPEGATQPGQATRFIIRQILPEEIDHYRVNIGAYERRGRSDLFPALGWIKRLRDYLTSHVVRADMLSRICWDLQVQGNPGAIQNLKGLLFPNGQPPPPGTVFAHNAATKLEAVAPPGSSGGGSRWDPVMDALVTMVANSIGLPKDWLGFGMTTTRASALVATEPAARSLEDLQGTIETILHDCFERVMAAAKITDAEAEFTFPSIATEDRSGKLKDVAFAESMNWVAGSTSGSIAAKELGITGYDYDEEQQLIASEWDDAQDTEDDSEKPRLLGPDGKPVGPMPQKSKQGDGTIRRPIVNSAYGQTPKLDPTRSVVGQEVEGPGVLVPFDGPAQPPAPGGGGGGAPPGAGAGGPQKPGGQQQSGTGSEEPTRGGVPAAENPMGAAGASAIKGALKAKEGEVTISIEDLGALLADAATTAAERMRENRRRPDHPEYQRNSEQYRKQTAAHLADLVREHLGAK